MIQVHTPRESTQDFKWRGWSNGAKRQDPKKSLGLPTKPKKSLDQNLTPQKIPYPGLLNSSKTHLFVLHLQNYATGALPIFFNTPKESLLKSNYPKNTCQVFVPQKIPESKISKPKRILWSSPSLEIPNTPPGYRHVVYQWNCRQTIFLWKLFIS